MKYCAPLLLLKTNQFDWTLDGIREKISRFLEQHGPHFEFDSMSFYYSMSKEESSGVIGERNSMKSNDMKYQFNKVRKKMLKPSFWPRFGPVGP